MPKVFKDEFIDNEPMVNMICCPVCGCLEVLYTGDFGPLKDGFIKAMKFCPKCEHPDFMVCLRVNEFGISLYAIEIEQQRVNYYEYIKSAEWKSKADAAKERAGGRCQVCNKTGNLNAHHRTYERLGKELPEDITVLCRDCHELYELNRKAKKDGK